MSRSGLVVLSVIGLFIASFSVSVNRLPVRADDTPAGRKLALLVGVKAYRHNDLKNLEYPENDVEELAALLTREGFAVTLLTTGGGRTDKDLFPDAANIRRQLTAILKDASKNDLIVVGLAGHGLQPLSSSQSYFCPYDANPSEREGKLVKPETLISIGEILGQLRESGIGQKLLMVDACRNDPQVRGSRRGVTQVDVSSLPEQTGVLLSCKAGEFSFESKAYGTGHGAFFFEVIEGLKGGAHDEDGEITWESLRSFVRKRVPAKVREVFGKDGGQQNPNEIGNLNGVPTVLAIARIVPAPKEKPEPTKSMSKPNEALNETPGTFVGTQAGQTRKDNALGTTLVWIPPGDFTMGSPKDEKDRKSDEDQVQVTLTKGFWLGQHELTQSEWQQMMHTTPWSSFTGTKKENYPATDVSWEDAMKFCEKVTQQEQTAGRLPSGWRYTLPTEAEWEYACRAGTKSRFSFGDDDSALMEYGWFKKNSREVKENYAHAVGQKKENPWGLFDMHGNVREWCRDWYGVLRGGTNPQGPSQGSARVYRGGSWDDYVDYGRSAFRLWGAPTDREYYVGFRVAAVASDK